MVMALIMPRMGIPMLGCFAFLVSMAFSPALCTIGEKPPGKTVINVGDDSDAPINNDHRERRPHEFEVVRTFLRVGENTPVYIAHRPDPKEPVNYTMLDRGIVKEAIDEWRAREPDSWTNVNHHLNSRNHRSIKEDRPPVETDDQQAIELRAMSEKLHSLDEHKRSGTNRSVNFDVAIIDIPILVVMDYPSDWPTNQKDEPKYIKEQILYAIAFWNAINWRYRRWDRPLRRIFITGIIIGRNKEAAPYLREHETNTKLNITAAINATSKYFKHHTLGHLHRRDSPLHFKPIMGVMTESKPEGTALYSASPILWNGKPKEMGYLFCDDHIFGVVKYFNEYRWVTPDEMRVMSPFVQNHPKAVQTFFGKRIPVLPMPGQVMSPNKQCELHGYNPDNQVCYFYDPCQMLQCRNYWLIWGICHKTSPPIDGTFCSDGKVCLGGECVSDRELIY